ncbi:MAG TPA: DUF2283 domain-containing protein [Methylomirabilota bacterium]|nr:DUF2283 domain-containing protein [Methylomirabilota bacterium]
MAFRYFPETDMLYIELINGVSMASEEVAPGVVLDFAENKRVVGIEIVDASKSIDLSRLEVLALPLANLVFNNNANNAPVAA